MFADRGFKSRLFIVLISFSQYEKTIHAIMETWFHVNASLYLYSLTISVCWFCNLGSICLPEEAIRRSSAAEQDDIQALRFVIITFLCVACVGEYSFT